MERVFLKLTKVFLFWNTQRYDKIYLKILNMGGNRDV